MGVWQSRILFALIHLLFSGIAFIVIMAAAMSDDVTHQPSLWTIIPAVILLFPASLLIQFGPVVLFLLPWNSFAWGWAITKYLKRRQQRT